MNDMTDFYDELDLKYPEIAIAMQDIDRVNPGKVKFSIPILTPTMDNDKTIENIERQNTSNLMNADKKGLDIQNIKISNYIEIPVPSELCALDTGEYEIINGIINISNANESITGTATGGSSEVGMNISGFTSKGICNLSSGEITGHISIIPTDRIIPAGSKWIVVFIGGDITKPRIIGRYIED